MSSEIEDEIVQLTTVVADLLAWNHAIHDKNDRPLHKF